MKATMTMQNHTFQPVYDENSRVLILGSFPSVKSRESNFYYGHPQNRFWKVMAYLTDWPVPETIEEKKQLLLANGIAIWDVIASCEIEGSSDSSIRNVTVCDLNRVLQSAPIGKIFANGAAAAKLYERHQKALTGMDIVTLPSTSPANAAWNLQRLCQDWDVVRSEIKGPAAGAAAWDLTENTGKGEHHHGR